jgi:glycosyltransferase involved in cell wall biosynthesis
MLDAGGANVSYSAIIPVGPRTDELDELITEYDSALASLGKPYEIIVVFDGLAGRRRHWLDVLQGLVITNGRLRIIELAREFGESSALAAGFDAAKGELLITLPAYYQIEPADIPRLFNAEMGSNDMLIAVRPRSGASFDSLRRKAFHALFRFTSGMHFRDLNCGVRLLKREVASEIPLYGEQHRFLPALARRRGFRVEEIELVQSAKDKFRGRYKAREYLQRLLDILTVFFLVRFTKKPLRFFGTIGFVAASFGSIVTLVLVVQRLFFGLSLANRPALLLATLFVVLGGQVFALGFVGELIIFTHASKMKEYTIRRVIQRAAAEDLDSPVPAVRTN